VWRVRTLVTAPSDMVNERERSAKALLYAHVTMQNYDDTWSQRCLQYTRMTHHLRTRPHSGPCREVALVRSSTGALLLRLLADIYLDPPKPPKRGLDAACTCTHVAVRGA